MPSVLVGTRCNRRVTCSTSPKNDRSESVLAANPADPYNMVGASKRFDDPQTYDFTLAAYYTFDGGQSWKEAPPLQLLNQGDPGYAGPTWIGISDPAIAWDNQGNVYLVAMPFGKPTQGNPDGAVGIAVYQSSDGGRTWSAPNLIHSSSGDDKQSAAGDPNSGVIYAAWDDVQQLAFARLASPQDAWTPATHLAGINDSYAPAMAIAADGTLYIVWIANGNIAATKTTQIKCVKSTDGGVSFSPPSVVADHVTTLWNLDITQGNKTQSLAATFRGATFRVLTIPAVCAGSGNNVIVAWSDLRKPVAQIYYRFSTDGGATWQGTDASGKDGLPLLTGDVASPSDRHDFHPQLASTPTGEIGCCFYEFGIVAVGEIMTQQIDVILAVSTDNGSSFPTRVTVNDRPWDPTVDEVYVDGDSNITFIGEYFGLAASPLGFFPFWTDTRTGTQEIFTSRLAVYPADVYIRDSLSDTGVPTPNANPGSWDAVDLIVRRQPDGDVNFQFQTILLNGKDHYIYGRAFNQGPNDARNVRLWAVVGNYPSLNGLPGAEFRYPQDWYSGDWDSLPLQLNHLDLGFSPAVTIPSGQSRILGPITWSGAVIARHPWHHPCLLGEVRADNDDSAGGPNGCSLPADPDPCAYGSYFWGNNNVSQRNLAFVPVSAGRSIVVTFQFLVGSIWSRARLIEVIIDKERALAETPLILCMDSVCLPGAPPRPACPSGELVFVEGGRVEVRLGDCLAGEILAAPGTVWRPHCPPAGPTPHPETCHGGRKEGECWRLTQPRAAIGFPVAPGELRRMTLSFTTPTTLRRGMRPRILIVQRNDRRILTGSVSLELDVT
jgi:hypothetical protein